MSEPVRLVCPNCGIIAAVKRPPDVPEQVATIRVICPSCDDGDFHAEGCRTMEKYRLKSWPLPAIRELPVAVVYQTRERLCATCHGTGEERFRQRGLRPEFNVWGCYPCDVDGEPGYTRECSECDGEGFVPFRWLPLIRVIRELNQ